MEARRSESYRQRLDIDGHTYSYHSLPKLAKDAGAKLDRLPRSIRILLENAMNQYLHDFDAGDDIDALLNWQPSSESRAEIQFMPVRVLLQDFTGVPAIADLAAIRASVLDEGKDPGRVAPLLPVDLVVDHSVQVDAYATPEAFQINTRLEFERNLERYRFLKWAQSAFSGLNVVPPATGICHQVNLEYLARVTCVRTDSEGQDWLRPDSLIGTDSHTPMVNGLGVLGWGVGGIEAEAAMLGQSCSMLVPEVVGLELKGSLRAGVTATDLVLTVTQILREHGVVGKFVEFTGSGVSQLGIADRATISNMAPEYGATVGYWPIDKKTVDYLKLTGRSEHARITEAYCQAQGLWASARDVEPEFSERLSLDLGDVESSIAGPSKPHDRVKLADVAKSFHDFASARGSLDSAPESQLRDGSLVIAAITSCTNTSNPALMIGAGLVAKKSVSLGLKRAPLVKSSFAPGSKAVMGYLRDADLIRPLEALGFHLVGFGCTTCIGNSGPLDETVAREIESRDLTVAAALSGNRNFEARIHPLVRANYLCSPPLVIAFAIAGRIDIDFEAEPLGRSEDGRDIFLKDVWPEAAEVISLMSKYVTPAQFAESYRDVFVGDPRWKELEAATDSSYAWNRASTYIQRPPFLDRDLIRKSGERTEIRDARILAIFGDFITTDHISPAGSIGRDSPAGRYLTERGVALKDFNSYGARRGNHEVMVRGTFANTRLKNLLLEREGGFTRHWPDGSEMTIYEAALKYKVETTPLVVIAGREYGSGSSRDWAAKGPRLLGVDAIIARSFERIHRSNLVGMGVLPLEIVDSPLDLRGDETITISGLDRLEPRSRLQVRATDARGASQLFSVVARVDTPIELRYYKSGGILPYILERFTRQS